MIQLCASCGERFELPAQRGRRPRYCSEDCRRYAAARRLAARRERAALLRQVELLERNQPEVKQFLKECEL